MRGDLVDGGGDLDEGTDQRVVLQRLLGGVELRRRVCGGTRLRSAVARGSYFGVYTVLIYY